VLVESVNQENSASDVTWATRITCETRKSQDLMEISRCAARLAIRGGIFQTHDCKSMDGADGPEAATRRIHRRVRAADTSSPEQEPRILQEQLRKQKSVT
jgi:hypothetical protein